LQTFFLSFATSYLLACVDFCAAKCQEKAVLSPNLIFCLNIFIESS